MTLEITVRDGNYSSTYKAEMVMLTLFRGDKEKFLSTIVEETRKRVQAHRVIQEAQAGEG